VYVEVFAETELGNYSYNTTYELYDSTNACGLIRMSFALSFNMQRIFRDVACSKMVFIR